MTEDFLKKPVTSNLFIIALSTLLTATIVNTSTGSTPTSSTQKVNVDSPDTSSTDSVRFPSFPKRKSTINRASFQLSPPAKVCQCEGRTAKFMWLSITAGRSEPPQIVWKFRSPKDNVEYAIMKRLPQGFYKYFGYQDRAEYVYNAGLKLLQISFADEGPYEIEIIFEGAEGQVIRLTGATSLTVYKKNVLDRSKQDNGSRQLTFSFSILLVGLLAAGMLIAHHSDHEALLRFSKL